MILPVYHHHIAAMDQRLPVSSLRLHARAHTHTVCDNSSVAMQLHVARRAAILDFMMLIRDMGLHLDQWLR